MRRLAGSVLALLLLAGCESSEEQLRIGSNAFAEQMLLAEMMALVAEDGGIEVERRIPYGDNRSNLRALGTGELDAYPEYQGSLLALSGRTSDGPAGDFLAVRELAESLGARWLGPFGFSNDFVLAVRRDAEIRDDLHAISDLRRLGRPINMAVDQGFVSRPIDGLYPLARAYGLDPGNLVDADFSNRASLYDALLDGTVDVIVAFATDPELDQYQLVVLDDDLGFFPSYEAASLVSAEALERLPAVAAAFERLAGRIDAATMRALISRVELLGEEVDAVARDFLAGEGLVAAGDAAGRTDRSVVNLAVSAVDELGILRLQATRAIRSVMPARPLQLVVEPVPSAALLAGRARFALLGAEEFFVPEPDGQARRVEGIEALGAVGVRYAHLIVPAGSTIGDLQDVARLGVGAEGDGSYRAATYLARALSITDQTLVPEPDPERLVAMLETGEVDALLLMLEAGHARVHALLDDGTIALAPIASAETASRALRYPFLRPVRLPAGTYPGQTQAIETVASQVVLAAAASPASVLGASGPASLVGLSDEGPQGVPARTVRRLREALPTRELVDPLLPASPGLLPEAPEANVRIVGNWLATVANVLVIGFLVWMAFLYFEELPKSPALRPERRRKNS